ncbi:MAG: GerAB/ArcD/ProY family transporter [Clostridiales bacterium]|nr:GerAB/ArcD/ProY family transporter [Clostridiales bacterium]
MLSKKQLVAITINAITVKMLITYPRALFVLCGNAAWINVIYCTLAAVLIFFVNRLVYKYDYNVIELAEMTGGKFLKIITGIVVFIVLGLNFFSILRIFPEMIRLVLLQNTYLEVIVLSFVAALVIGAYCGIEAIGRAHTIFIPLAGIVFTIFIVLLIPSFKIENIFPILGNGPYNIFIKGISSLSIFSDLLMLNILIPHMKNVEYYRSAGNKSVWIGGAFVFLIVVAYSMSYVYPVSANFLAPVYQLERLINLSDFFSRFEAVFQFIWSVSILLYGSLYLEVLSEVWKESFGLKFSKPLIIPIITVLTGAILLPNSLNNMIIWEYIINKWIYIPALAIPIIIAVTARIKRIKNK